MPIDIAAGTTYKDVVGDLDTSALTIPSGSNRYLLVGICWWPSSATISDVWWDFDETGGTKQALTHLGSGGPHGTQMVSWYGLVAPRVGNFRLFADFSGVGGKEITAGIFALTGVDQGTPAGTVAAATGTSTTPSVTVSSAAGELVFDAVVYYNVNATVDGSQTQRWNYAADPAQTTSAGSTEAGAASVSMDWTLSGSVAWVIAGVSIKAAPSYVLDAESATYTVTATAAGGGKGVRLDAASASYLVTPTAATLSATSAGFATHGVLRGSHNASVNLPWQILRLPAVFPTSGTPSISVKLRKEDTSTGGWTGKLVYYGPAPVDVVPEPEDEGELIEGVNPDLGASLCDIHDPVMWLELETDEGRKRYSANTDLTHEVTYHGGPKRPRLLRTGPISRALSDWMGAFESGHTTTELADTDGVIRGLLTSGELLNREVAIYLIDYAASMLGLTPRRIFGGQVRRYKPLHDLIVRLDLIDALGALLEQFSDTKLLPQHVMDTTMYPNLPPELEGKPIPIIYGACSDEDLGTAGKGVVPAIYVGERFIPVHGRNWGEFLIGIGEVDVVGWWGGNAAGTDRAKMPTTTEGVTWLVPGFAGYTTAFGPTRTRTFVNAKGDSIEATYIYVQGPQWDWARSGQVPITVNVHGRKDANGVMIRSLPLQIADFLINFVLQNGTGPQMAIPTIGDPAYSAVDTASFQEAHEVSSTRLGATGSPFTPYLGAWMLGHDGTRISLAEWIQRATTSCDLDLGVNKDGQLMASMQDTSLPISKRFLDYREIIDQTHDIDVDIEKLHNTLKYRYARRYITPIEQPTPPEGVRLPKDAVDRDWLSGEQVLSDSASITAVRQEKTLELDLHMVRDQTTADSVAAYRLARSKQAPVFGAFETNLCALDVELGKVIGDTHFAGLGANGWTDERLRVRRLVLQPCDFTDGSDPDSNFRVALTGHDITDLE